MPLRVLLSAVAVFCTASSAAALELRGMIKESAGQPPAGAPPPCGPISAQRNGNCGNYRWYNVCSGYIWIFSSIPTGDGFGTRFSNSEGMFCVFPGNTVKRTVTYFRNVVPNYGQTVDVFLNRDNSGDGCPDALIAQDLNLDPGLRWNCSNFGVAIPAGVTHLIVRSTHDGGNAPTWATDGPFTQVCDPNGNDHSYYYPAGGGCIAWRNVSPTGRGDNFLTHLIIDGGPHTPTKPVSWGEIKGLNR